MLNKSLVLFTLIAFFAVATANAAPAANSGACEGALPLATLIRVEIVKGDYSGCPRGARSPYLCALHKAGFAERSLGHAMRHTLVDLGNGTCERVNLRGVLIWKADGSTLEGDKFVDSRKVLPSHSLRFGAWKTAVLYLAPGAGQQQLAQCTQERGVCEEKLAKVERCRAVHQFYDPATAKCVDKPAAAPTAAAAQLAGASCPECPICTAKVGDLRGCATERDALRSEVDGLKPRAAIGDKAQECEAKAELFNPKTGRCVPSAGVSPILADAAAVRIAALEAEVALLQRRLLEARRRDPPH